MITLKNWYQQQPEVVYFVQLVRSEMSKEQWDKTIAEVEAITWQEAGK